MISRRFPTISKSDCREIVNQVNLLREIAEQQELELDATTRTCMKIALLICIDLPLRQAVEYVIVNQCSAEDKKIVLDSVNSNLGVL